MGLNIMMDLAPLCSEIPHPVNGGRSYDFKRRVRRFTRTQRPVKYYYIDFGHSRKYAPDNNMPLEEILIGGDKSVPEFHGKDEPQNPFWTDIYYLGNLIRIGFLQVRPSDCSAISRLTLLTSFAESVWFRVHAVVGR